MEEGSNGADLNNSDNDSSDVSHQNGFNNSTYTMEIGIAKLDSSYLENHMQCAKVMQTSSSPQSAAGRVDLCDLSTEEGANPPSLPQNVYEEIGEVSKEGNSREKLNRSRSLSSEDVFASSDSDDYVEPVSSPKSVNTDDSLPCSPTKMDENSPEISNEYEALSPATQVCTSYTSLTLKSPNQSTADDISDTKETDIYDNCDVYNKKEVPNISALETSDNQIVRNSEKTTSDDHQQNENLLINAEDKAIVEHAKAKDEDEQADDDVKDSCSVKSDQGSVEYLNDDISCDMNDEFKTDEKLEDTNNYDEWDTVNSENQCEFNLGALESMNLIEDELTRNEFVGKIDVELNSLKLRNKIDEDMKDSSSVASVQGSVSYLDDISYITDDNLSISTGRADQCLSEVDYKEFSEEGNKESLIDSERKPDSKQYSRDDHHTCSSANSESDLNQIPSNLVKRLSQQFSKSMGDLRYVPFPFAARKTSLPGHYKVTYKSSTFLILSPNSMQERQFVYEPGREEEKGPKGQKTTRTKEEETRVEDSGTGQTTVTTTKTTTIVENGDVSHESQESSARKPTVQEEIMSVEGGVYENEPVRDPGVVRESDPKNIGEELPEVGMAKNILQRYAKIQEESAKPVVGKRQASPPKGTGPIEYVSEPRTVIEKPEQKVEGGIFENQPVSEEGVVKSYDTLEDVKPEQGYAKNVLAKFKEIESQVQNRPPPSPKRELTPDRFTKGEYVSEPRSTFEKYEGKTESGIFESQPKEDKDVVKSYEHGQEVLPEQGMARNLVSKFKEYQSQSKSPTSPREKKELTPDRLTKGEYVSEPRTTFEQYEGQVEAGVYESKPQDRGDIVKSGEYYEEPLPEQGYAKNVISKFKDIQKGGGSPAKSPSNKPRELTPPRQDTFSGVLENQPQERSDVVHSYDVYQEELPETGTTRNLLNKFKEIQHSGSNSPASPRLKKEFTPPPQSGVYENTPTKGIVYEERVPESGILENNPERREGVAREEEPSAGTVEFPERGYAKNMVSKWKQLETEHSKSASPSPRYKEFTPPREEPRIKSPLSPKSPAGTNSSVHPRDLPGQYQEQMAPGIYENEPSHRDDIAREEDTDWEQGLPREGTSKSLISKFKNVQEEAKKSQEVPKPISRRDSTDGPRSPKKKMFEESSDSPERGENDPSSVGTEDESIGAPTADNEANPKSPFVAVQLEKCAACQKTVYAMEKIEMNKNCYHRACFKCSHCNSRLTAKTFSMNEGVIYCTNHFKQLFARKGNYDEGFGRQQYKKRWQGDQPNGEKQTVPEPTA